MRQLHAADSSNWPEIWKSAYRILEDTIIPTQLKTWIEPMEVLGLHEKEGILEFEFGIYNTFSANWIMDHHIKEIERALEQVTGKKCKMLLKIQGKSSEDRTSAYHVLAPASAMTTTSPSAMAVGGKKSEQPAALDSRFTFENFVVGASNQFAHASAFAVAENPALHYNPLFLYSSPGLGKTHLLQAIGNHVLQKNPAMRVAYLSAESFKNELIDSILHGKDMTEFRNKFRSSFDVLLIDDIQSIAGAKQTEEEFFHTFNTLYGSKRQIVLTSDRPPKEIKKLEERIRTRFESGLVADIQPPEIETRIAILKTKAERDDIYLPDEVATFLATHIKSNVRELEGTLIKLQFVSSMTGAEISLDMAMQELKSLVHEESSRVTPESIQVAVASYFNIKISDIKSSTRSRNFAFPRQIAMYLVRKYTSLGWNAIAEYFEKDRTTVMHGFEKIEADLLKDQDTQKTVEAIQNRL